MEVKVERGNVEVLLEALTEEYLKEENEELRRAFENLDSAVSKIYSRGEEEESWLQASPRLAAEVMANEREGRKIALMLSSVIFLMLIRCRIPSSG